jgi:hypothetical protein
MSMAVFSRSQLTTACSGRQTAPPLMPEPLDAVMRFLALLLSARSTHADDL